MNIEISKITHRDKMPMELLLQADPSEEMIQKYLYSGDTYLARSGEEVVGVFVLVPKNEEEVELKNISVAEQHQRKGIGTEIVKYVIRISKMDGFKRLIVKTADSSLKQKKFYEKLKFEAYFIVKGHYVKYYEIPIIEDGRQAIDQIVYRRRL